MNFKYINKLFLVLIFFVVYSCQNLENITKKENAKNTEIINYTKNNRSKTREMYDFDWNYKTKPFLEIKKELSLMTFSAYNKHIALINYSNCLEEIKFQRIHDNEIYENETDFS